VPAVQRLVESAYRGDDARAGWTHEADLLDGTRTDAGTLAAIIDDPRERILVAEAEGAIAGCVQLSEKQGGVAYLGLLAVDPKRQAGGLGRQIIAAAEAEAIAFGARVMELSAIAQRAELIAYYERRGYRRSGEVRPFPILVDPPLQLIVLAKRLTTRS
jgi:GNAT superfamily N-acetyltransferase